MAILEVKKLTLRFGGLTAVNNLSFDIEENSIISLIGPNGAGKTSAFNCLTGFYKATEGEIIFQGKNIVREKPHKITKLGMGRTFQNLRLFKDMTVLENVMSGMHSRTRAGVFGAILRPPGQVKEERKIHQVAEDCLDFVGILDKKDRLARNLAYGDQRRVEWARALATQPKLLLLDEPAAGLNHDEKEQLVQLIRRIRSDLAVTVLLIEHDMGLVMKVSEKIVVIDYGQKIAEGTTDEVKNNPRVIEAYLGKEDEE
ncbi:MAG: ABC transporter ATP-binding protein [Desulfitobacteriaceae bacterium]|nr:ABC transporter ATP-binding protein [Desulfitobacteriaceae bacterium]MDI6878918.1 ABC transporter ATP-binding protein [Desulfitobacteriaceae bacterium]MDI6913349.1 ABC transporter ATP-binding protein [Desulfitobacteriaceae bacterium]